MLGALQPYVPAIEALLGLLGPAQRQWLQANIGSMAAFLNSDNGKAALLMFFEEFGDFVVAKSQK